MTAYVCVRCGGPVRDPYPPSHNGDQMLGHGTLGRAWCTHCEDYQIPRPETRCAKCGHEHAGRPCRARVDNLECRCWIYEAPRQAQPA